MSSCQIIPSLILLGIILGSIFFIRPWEVPTNNTIRVIRSIGVGIITGIFIIGGFMILGWTKINDHCLNSIPDFGIEYLACFVFPLSIGASIGFYFGYRQLSWLLSIRKKINREK